MKEIEQLRQELIALVREAGSDYKASELLKPLCGGFAPDRSTLGKFRRGEGKPSLIAMTVALLRVAVAKKLRVDRVGGSPYYVHVETGNPRGDDMHLVSKEVFEIALVYRGINIGDARKKIDVAFAEGAYEAAERQLSDYIAESGLYFHDQPELSSYRYYLDKDGAAVVGEGVMPGTRDIGSERMVTHHEQSPRIELKLNLLFPGDHDGNLEVEFESYEDC